MLVKNPVHPHCHLVDEELDILFRVMVPYPHRVTFTIGTAAGIDHVEDRIRLPEIVEELVAQSLALVGIRHETGYID